MTFGFVSNNFRKPDDDYFVHFLRNSQNRECLFVSDTAKFFKAVVTFGFVSNIFRKWGVTVLSSYLKMHKTGSVYLFWLLINLGKRE